ncbi:MAG: peptidoglycan DD-metalloendopeptidase family protein, partial [Clostridia bacterium]|nr:peptidoglycan DD-metalloendopeptidase family protein [Clostridia bacterium]
NKESNLLSSKVEKLKTELSESRANLEEAESELDGNIALAKERIRAMYELGDTSYLSLVLGAESIEDFTTRYQVVKQMSEYDQKVINQLKATKQTIEEETLAIETMTNEQEDALSALEGNVSALRQKQAQSQSLINRFNQQSEENQKAIEAAEAAEEELQAEIREAMANSNNDLTFDGKFLWPVDGYYSITDVFGMRTHPITGVYKLHTGVDIAGGGISGKPIRAAGDGVVLKSGYNTAYGNYVVIVHGVGYSTLYAHASRLCVSAGQVVVRGDTVAYVGSTGYSTGAHLHFEVIQNGTQLNPLNFFEGYNFKFL